jgi:cation:H+ antiporter
VATALGVSQWAIGVTIVAAGTSLPELVTCLAASLRGKNDMLLGNLLGSDFFNFAGVLGLTALLRPLGVEAGSLPSLWMLVGSVALVLLLLRTGWRLGRVEGALLILVSLLRWGVDFA